MKKKNHTKKDEGGGQARVWGSEGFGVIKIIHMPDIFSGMNFSILNLSSVRVNPKE